MSKKFQILNFITQIITIICLVIIIVLIFPKNTTVDTNNPSSQSSKVEMMKIETPYVTLDFPSEFSDYLYLTEKNEGGVFSKTFHCALKDEKIELFTVYFGSEDNGKNVGYINKENNKIPFNFSFATVERDKSWSEEDYLVVCAMQEAVNDVLNSVKASTIYTEN